MALSLIEQYDHEWGFGANLELVKCFEHARHDKTLCFRPRLFDGFCKRFGVRMMSNLSVGNGDRNKLKTNINQ